MLSLILTVFFVHIAIYLINTIGASTVDNLVRISAKEVRTSRTFATSIAQADTCTVMAPVPSFTDTDITHRAQTAAAEASGA